MAIGERIRFLRNLRGMTQKYLGMKVGFSESTAEVRMAQYENGARTPKEKMIADFASILDVSTHALTVPDIDTDIGLIHTLFTLEDRYGLNIDEADDEVCLKVNMRKSQDAAELHKMLCAWRQVAAMLKAGEITQEEYDRWRYHYPEYDTSGQWHKVVPSQRLSDILVDTINISKTEGKS